MKRLLELAALCCLALLAWSCTPERPAPAARIEPIRIGEQPCQAHVVTRQQDSESIPEILRKLAPGEVLLRLFPQESLLEIDLGTVNVSLSVAFVQTGGTVQEVRDVGRSAPRRARAEWIARYFIAAPQGWFAERKIGPGTEITLPPSLQSYQQRDEIPLEIAGRTVRVEVVRDPLRRERGLMFRKTLPPNSGMLFVYPSEQPLFFWMKNTELPLSIAYLGADGTILEIYNLEPHSERQIASLQPAQFALEMAQGWYHDNHIVPGDRVVIPP